MILVTLGSQKFPFDRLLEAVDKMCADRKIEDVFAQTGFSNYVPRHYAYERFLDKAAFDRAMDRADVVISHGGTGAIITALRKGKKVIAVPRRAEYGEHVDDHQVRFIEQFGEMGLLRACAQCSELPQALADIRHAVFNEYRGGTAKIINSIEEYIEESI